MAMKTQQILTPPPLLVMIKITESNENENGEGVVYMRNESG
jgi:hypothetical protein